MSTASLSGYYTHDTFYATRYKQGGRTVYNIDLSLLQIDTYLPIPDPQRPTEGNRRVKESHARAFGEYVRKQEEWVSPALLLRAPNIFQFEPKEEIAGTQFGILSLPRVSQMELRILDGQHRILGIRYGLESIAKELAEVRSGLAQAKKLDSEAAVVRQYEEKIKELERQRERFERERMSLQIHLEDDADAYKQMFVDVADNALGITSAIRARFDNRRIVNRCLDDVLKHALLAGRVDLEQDRVGGKSAYLMGAKHVVDLIRTVAVGIDGRIGARRENELNEPTMVEETNDFLDLLLEAYPILAEVADGQLPPENLRKTSLLGSNSMLRVLAGVYHELLGAWENEEIGEFFAKLEPLMDAPIKKDSPWLQTGAFDEGAVAPGSRAQDLRSLVRQMVEWAKSDPDWLYEGNGRRRQGRR
jgi:hypothetical protein